MPIDRHQWPPRTSTATATASGLTGATGKTDHAPCAVISCGAITSLWRLAHGADACKLVALSLAMNVALTLRASVASPGPLGQLRFVEKTISTRSTVVASR